MDLANPTYTHIVMFSVHTRLWPTLLRKNWRESDKRVTFGLANELLIVLGYFVRHVRTLATQQV